MPIFGQQVTFNVLPGNAFVRINGEVLDLSKQNSISLPPGTYVAEIWAPRFEVNREKVVVEEGKAVTVSYGMKTTSATYQNYLEERYQYNTAKLKRTLTGGVLVSTTAAAAYVALAGRRNKLGEIEALINNRRAAYEIAANPVTLEQFGNQYNLAVTDYEETQTQHNQLVVVGTALALVGVTASVLHFTNRRRERLTKPDFIEGNPFTFRQNRSGSYLTIGTTSSLLGLTLNF